MQPSHIWLLICLAWLGAEAKDFVCKGKTKGTIKIGEGDSSYFKIQSGAQKTKCSVTYKKKRTCPILRFSCSQFNIKNKKASCRGLDRMATKTKGKTENYCKGTGPDLKTSASLIVSFVSKKKSKSIATCVAECVSPTTTTATTTATTTTAATTTSTETTTTSAGAAGTRSYLAGLSYSFDSSNSPFCAGSLISSQWVLTTASCSYSDGTKTGAGKVRVVLGEETLGTTDQENFKVVSVKKIIVHPSYSPSSSTGQNNLALWKLSEAVSTSVYSTVCLPTQGTEQDGAATLVGWRISEVVGSLSQSLTQTDTQLVSDTECGVSDTILCTAGDSTGCQGDYGGPLLQGDNTLIGAVSNNRGCSKNQYGIFTQISKFSTWIQTQVADNGGGTVCVQ